ncbi:MAG: hypothetical protein Q9200_002491 [Gallowayella weberi]
MPEERTPSENDSDHKTRSHHRWRAKLSRTGSKASQDGESRDQAIQSFLHIPTGVQTTAAATPRLGSSFEVQRDLRIVRDAPLPDIRRKPPRKPNLHVAFVTTPPVIIGEGGDEATLPAIEVSSHSQPSLESSMKDSLKTQDQRSTTAPASGKAEVLSENDGSFRPMSLQRRSTGLRDDDPDKIPEHETQSANTLSQKLNMESAPFRERETSCQDPSTLQILPASRSPCTDDGIAINNRDDATDLEQQHSRKGSDIVQVQSPLLNPATSFANSLTPSPSPQYPIRSAVSSEVGYPFPAATPHTQSSSTLADREPLAQVTQQQSLLPTHKLVAGNRGLSLRDVAKNLGEDALLDFATRVQPFRNVFLLGLNTHPDPTLEQWVTAASWWFIKGRSELESFVRSQAKSRVANGTKPLEIPQDLKQAYIDLAKVCWIVTDMTPDRCPEVKPLENKGPIPLSSIMQSFVDVKTAELVQIHLSLVSNLRALAMSMKRNDRMPPSGLELQGSDVRIFLKYPSLSPSAARLLSSERYGMVAADKDDGLSSFFPMPISDTERHFNYGRMFVDCFLNQGKRESRIRIPCLLSVLRDRRDRDITLIVASQDGQVNLVIQPEMNRTLSWRDIHWKIQYHYIEVDLRADFELHIQFQERDFKTLWGIHDYIRSVRQGNQASETETLVFEDTLRSFQYCEQGKTGAHFPVEAVADCTLRLFGCFSILREGNGERRVYDGYRLMVVTPRKVKTLSAVSHSLGRQTPILFSYLRDDQGGPAMLLKISKSSRDPSMVMSFLKQANRELLHALLSGTGLSRDEHCSDALNLESITISTDLGLKTSSLKEVGSLGSFNWKTLRVLGQAQQHMQLGSPKVRIWAECETGCLVDHINLGPGELQIYLDPGFSTRIRISRPAQKDMTVCFADNSLSKEQYEALRQMLVDIRQSPSVKMFSFQSIKDLHAFQALITGFSVLFDGFARTFSISRRRMVVPIHKRWEALGTRIQIVSRDKTIQLLAFFKDFSHGTCMNFALKSTDVFECFTRSNHAYLSIVDAKFALPKSEKDSNHDFISLDMPEYPAEHDDITICFESEQGIIYLRLIPQATASRVMELGRSTRAMHADDLLNSTPDVAPPLHVSTTFRYADDPKDLVPVEDVDIDTTEGHVYSRETAPTSTRLETILTPLLNAPCVTYASGLAALHAAYVYLNPGCVSIGDGYHGSHGVLDIQRKLCRTRILPLDCAESDLQQGDVIHLETPLNPTGEAYDIREYARKAHSRGAILLVDSTFGPPGLQDPFEWGADIVMHSGTKYLGGHSDMLCGVLATNKKEWLAGLKKERTYLGSVIGSMEGWLGIRSLRTLDLRVKRQSENACKLVHWLDFCKNTESENEEAVLIKSVVERIHHASLQHKEMHWLKQQMPNGFGPVFAILAKDEDMARRLPSFLTLFHHATSLGGVESLIEWRRMSDRTVDPRLLRVSVGVEDWEDLKADLIKGFTDLLKD